MTDKKSETDKKADKKLAQEDLKKRLSPVSYAVTQEAFTERPFTSPLNNEWRDGIYVDIVSGEALFSSKDKFDAGCGWPSFAKALPKLKELEDRSKGYIRTEVRSEEADSHLGHVFTDGPAEMGGLRYCINGAALRFVPKEDMEKEGYGEYLKYV